MKQIFKKLLRRGVSLTIDVVLAATTVIGPLTRKVLSFGIQKGLSLFGKTINSLSNFAAPPKKRGFFDSILNDEPLLITLIIIGCLLLFILLLPIFLLIPAVSLTSFEP